MAANRLIILIVSFLVASICALLCPIAIQASARGITLISDLSHQNSELGEYKALIIGINEYKDPKISDLKTAINDATAMAKLLGERYGFSDIKLLLDHEATRGSIYRALRKLVSSTKPDDSVLIYYAGHGDLDRLTNDGWWIPSDAKGGDPVTYLENVTVQSLIKNMKARHVLVISDSCYSGTLFGTARAIPPIIDDKYYLNLYNEKSRWGMTSGNKTPVADDGTGGHSVFAYQLLKELRKSDKPYISAQELYTRIAPIVSNNSEQTPLCRPIRNTGDQGGEFVFVASSSAIDEEPPPGLSWSYLSVQSNVLGARVFVDGREVGSTNLSDTEILPGEHRIKIEKDGYEPYYIIVRLTKGQVLPLVVNLSRKGPPKGRLYVDTEPENARVRVLNIKPRFFQGMELDSGPYHIEVTAEGYEPERKWIDLAAGHEEPFKFELTNITIGEPVPPPEVITNSIGMKFVLIPAGSFTMGSQISAEEVSKRYGGKAEWYKSEHPSHEVKIGKPFYLQTTEVTQGQWKEIMGTNPSFFKDCGENCPVERVSWEDAHKFISKLNQKEGIDKYRLPTEAEWEYACRSGTTTLFFYGDDADKLDDYGWYSRNSNERAHPVATLKPNSWGLYDMHGNVWEWVEDDWHDPYEGAPNDSRAWVKAPRNTNRVFRGGAWDDDQGFARCAGRVGDDPGLRDDGLGFRCVKTIQ